MGGKPSILSLMEPDAEKGRVLDMDLSSEIQIMKQGDANLRAHAFVREYINNGFLQSQAAATVYGIDGAKARSRATMILKRPEAQQAVMLYLRGAAEPEELTKDWALKIWQAQIEMNVLDYLDEEGGCLTVAELRSLPIQAQRAIKALSIDEQVMDRVTTTKDDEGGKEVTKERVLLSRHVKIELIDKQKALEQLAKAQKWIQSTELKLSITMSPDFMMDAADRRVEELAAPIEGESERVDDKG